MKSELPYSFGLLYDINTKEDLESEVEYLLHRLRGIRNLCKDEFPDVVKYIDCFGGIENA